MKHPISLFSLILLALVLTSCAPVPADTHEADTKAIMDNETQWNSDWAAKDLEKLVAHYAEDGALMVPGMPVSSGKEAIRKTFKDMIGDVAFSLKFQASKVEVSKGGDVGYTQGSYRTTMTDPNSKQVINDHGSYVTTYRKLPDGSWKAVADIATSEVPTPTPAKK